MNSTKLMGGGELWMVQAAGLLSEAGNRVCMVGRTGGRYLTAAGKKGLRCASFRLGGDFNPFLIGKLRTVLAREETQIVVANTARDIRLAAFARVGLRCRPKILGLHQIDRPMPDRWNYRVTFNHFVDRLVVNSRATKSTLATHNSWLDIGKVHVIPHGIDFRLAQSATGQSIRQELSLASDSLLVGFVGRLTGQKGISTLLPALESVLAKESRVEVILVGEGTLEKKVRKFAKATGFERRIHILGFRSDVPWLMREFDVLVVPSLWEGFGLVVLEAKAAGTACVASRVSSIPEIIDHGVNGMLVPPKDPDALATAVLHLMGDSGLRQSLGNAAQRKVLESFTNERMIEGYEQVFRSMLS